jgi:D-alanyl-D-alanine carboxypeptidase
MHCGNQRTRTVVGVLCVVAALISGAARAQTTDKPMERRLDKYLSLYLAMNDFSGTILVGRNGKYVLAKSYGLANRETDTPNSLATQYRVGSISKQFTAAAILVLADRGKVDLQAPVERYVTGIPNGAQITIFQLLTHTSGLSRDLSNKREYSAAPHTVQELIGVVRTLPPASAPSSKFSYSNNGYLVLAAVVEAASGQRYDKFLKESVFEPVGMNATRVDDSLLILPHRASGYQTGVGTALINAHFEDMSNEIGYGSVISTAPDLFRWEQAWHSDKLLTPKSWNAMFTDYGHHYGYGVSIHEQSGHEVVGHDGAVSGFDVFVRKFPKENISIVYASNIQSGLLSNIQEHLADLFVDGKDVPSSIRPAPASVPEEILRSYEQTCSIFPGLELQVKEADGILSLRGGPDEWWFALTPVSNTHFFYRHLFADVTFVTEADGTVSGLKWKDYSAEYPCKRNK